MNIIKVFELSVLFSFIISSAWAEEKNFGKDMPKASEIIEHFKQPAGESESAPADDYQDVPESDLHNTRGLKKISTVDKATGHKVQLPTTVAEKAISLEILFDYNSDKLTEQAKAQLEPVGRALSSGELSGLRYRIEGHTDVVGGYQYNIDLSRRRAEAVKNYLLDQYKISSASIQIEGKGKSDLADAANPTSEANRRVRIVRLGN